MKLDKRIKSRKDIFDCFNAEKAGKYIGEHGYFVNNLSDFSDLAGKQPNYGTLGAFHQELDSPFYLQESATVYNFFLPESLLLKLEKKYRPYTLEEFTEKFKVGLPIKFRKKDKVGCERYLILNGYEHEQRNDQTITYIYIGVVGYTFDELFNEYEWQEHYTEDYKPFGVEE